LLLLLLLLLQALTEVVSKNLEGNIHQHRKLAIATLQYIIMTPCQRQLTHSLSAAVVAAYGVPVCRLECLEKIAR
jgi:hypothetical protein